MIGQTIPSTVPENPPVIVQQFDELAQTGGPSWLFPVLMVGIALFVLGAFAVYAADRWRGWR